MDFDLRFLGVPDPLDFNFDFGTPWDAVGADEYNPPGLGIQAVRWQDFNMVQPQQPRHTATEFARQDNVLPDHAREGPAAARRHPPHGGVTTAQRGGRGQPIMID